MVAVGPGGNFALSVAAPFLRFEPTLLQFRALQGFLARAGLPAAAAGFAAGSGLDPSLLLLAMLALLLVLGCVMDPLALILVVVPFLWPALVALNGGEFVSPGDAAFVAVELARVALILPVPPLCLALPALLR